MSLKLFDTDPVHDYRDQPSCWILHLLNSFTAIPELTLTTRGLGPLIINWGPVKIV